MKIIQQADSLHHTPSAQPVEGQFSEENPSEQATVELQPTEETLEEEESVAVQERFVARPDTVREEAIEKEKAETVKEIILPQYYRESFFSKDSLFHPEISGGRYGVAGDPVPYTVRGDNMITSLLLACFVLALISFARSRDFIFRQAKEFFVIRRGGQVTEPTETTSEFRFQFFLAIQTCLLASVIAFLYTQEHLADNFILKSQHTLIWIFFGCFVVYFLAKSLLYAIVNGTFFDRKRNRQWQKSLLFLTCVEGVALFPSVMLQVYFNMSMQDTVIYAIIVVILTKILLFYKSFAIFFRQNGSFLQIILYFCALEFVPLFFLGGLLVTVVDFLKINI